MSRRGNRYEIRIRGTVSEPVLETLEGVEATVQPAETILRGAELDQSALYGVLDRLQDLGLELIEVRRVSG